MSKFQFGKYIVSPHAIERYIERVMNHRNQLNPEPSKVTERKIRNELSLKNVLATVNFGEKYKFIFTKSNVEFRFERKTNDLWVLTTCIRHLRLMESEEPLNYRKIKRGDVYGIRTAILIRKHQAKKWNKNSTLGEVMNNEN